MMFPKKNLEDLKDLNKLVSLENQGKIVKWQNRLGKQIFHEDMKQNFATVPKSIKDVSEEMTKTITEFSIKNIKAIKNLNEKVSELKNDNGMIAS